MLDSRNVIYPMTAGDLVQSALIVGQRNAGRTYGAELRLLEVVDVGYDTEPAAEPLSVRVRDVSTGEEASLHLNRDTPVLVTGITRR